MAATSGKNSAPRQRAAGLPGPARPAGRPYGPIQPYTVQLNAVEGSSARLKEWETNNPLSEMSGAGASSFGIYKPPKFLGYEGKA